MADLTGVGLKAAPTLNLEPPIRRKERPPRRQPRFDLAEPPKIRRFAGEAEAPVTRIQLNGKNPSLDWVAAAICPRLLCTSVSGLRISARRRRI